MKLRSLFFLPLAASCTLVPLATPGCGVRPPAADDAGVNAPSDCTVVTVTGLARGSVAGWIDGKATTSDGSGPSAGYSFRIELDEPKGTKLAPGSYDLSNETSYGDASHAVLAWDGGDDPTTASTVFFQASGTLQLDVVSSPPSGESKGSLSGVKLVESTIDPTTYASHPVANGRCLFVASAAWDTTVAAGAQCATADECGDPNKNVCDPATKACAPSQCDSDAACGTGKTCIVQAADGTAGACYPSCTPLSGGGCSGDAECVVVRYDQSVGICKSRGAGQEGDACTISDVSTACGAGMVCSLENAGNLCRKQCDYFAQTSGACPSAQHCVLGSVCSDEPIDPAAIDAACDGSSSEGTPCALNVSAGTTTGVCVAETTSTSAQVMMCRKVCRKSTTSDCPTGKSCADYWDSTGVCR